MKVSERHFLDNVCCLVSGLHVRHHFDHAERGVDLDCLFRLAGG